MFLLKILVRPIRNNMLKDRYFKMYMLVILFMMFPNSNDISKAMEQVKLMIRLLLKGIFILLV